ncbi:tetratricopeptide repeat protein [Parasphingorhabdus sp.]|uniref:tetratricopeptide repeat protein n=1 Tax=Parasphingorhabdus sp. TaxID=2709688 RepID=UPI003C788C62
MKIFGITILLASLLASTPASAQNANTDKRVDRLEQEMRAIQRKVFPGGATRYFEPEITADTGPASPKPASTTSAVTDLIARVDALEASLANLTGQVEENGFRLKKIEDRLAATGESTTSSDSASANGSTPIVTPKAAPEAAPDPERVVGVAAIVMPDTGDSAEDAYIYGYRLWEAKFYPEAQAQLKKMAEEHSGHRRASFAQNLLGRAYLDDSKPALASVALYENYQKRPRGERAPDSLYFLSTALVQLKKNADACRVLAEMQEVYPEVASGRLADRVASGKTSANCK